VNILILSKVSIPEAGRYIPDWHTLGYSYRVTDQAEDLETPPDVIISMGIGVMEETFKAVGLYPKAKLFCYHWDCYEWVWSNPRPGEYDYARYGKLLAHATEIWVPSECTRMRTFQWWSLESVVVKTSVPYWEHETTKGDYVLCTLRKIPDRHWDSFEWACKEAGLPYKMLNHELSYTDYQKEVANCRFLVSHLYEASTGGLSLLEGYYLGKPVLIHSSLWNGANEYFYGRQHRYQHVDCMPKLLELVWEHTPVEPDHRQFVTEHYSSETMVSQIEERLHANRART
jgi:hypothetical protein